MQSLARKIKRGHARFKESPFVKNADGTPKMQLERKTKRGRWIIVN